MRIIGLTGGIGSGKSFVSDLFKDLGIHVSDADHASRSVLDVYPSTLRAIAKKFGAACIADDGSLDRVYLRKVVFGDEAKRVWLEQLLHPLIERMLEQELATAHGHYAILSSALLFETKQNRMTMRNLVVDSSQEQQLSRSMARDKNSEAQIRAIMKAQLSREERLALADDVVDNSGSLDNTRRQVLKLHEKYLQL